MEGHLQMLFYKMKIRRMVSMLRIKFPATNRILTMIIWKIFIQQGGREMNQLQEKITQKMTNMSRMTKQTKI